MFLISKSQLNVKDNKKKFLSYDKVTPEMFVDGVRPEMGFEYCAKRTNQIADMIVEEMYGDNFDKIMQGVAKWPEGINPVVEITVYHKWVVVEIGYCGRIHTLCIIWWSYKDLSNARLELRGEIEILNSWLKRIDSLPSD